MENTTGNYLKNGNESVLGLQCLKTLRLQLGNLGGQQRKWLARRQLCHPEEHNVIFSLLPPTSTRSNGKRYNCTLKKSIFCSNTVNQEFITSNSTAQNWILKICFNTQNSKNQWQNQGLSHYSSVHLCFMGNIQCICLTLHMFQNYFQNGDNTIKVSMIHTHWE